MGLCLGRDGVHLNHTIINHVWWDFTTYWPQWSFRCLLCECRWWCLDSYTGGQLRFLPWSEPVNWDLQTRCHAGRQGRYVGLQARYCILGLHASYCVILYERYCSGLQARYYIGIIAHGTTFLLDWFIVTHIYLVWHLSTVACNSHAAVYKFLVTPSWMIDERMQRCVKRVSSTASSLCHRVRSPRADWSVPSADSVPPGGVSGVIGVGRGLPQVGSAHLATRSTATLPGSFFRRCAFSVLSFIWESADWKVKYAEIRENREMSVSTNRNSDGSHDFIFLPSSIKQLLYDLDFVSFVSLFFLCHCL